MFGHLLTEKPLFKVFLLVVMLPRTSCGHVWIDRGLISRWVVHMVPSWELLQLRVESRHILGCFVGLCRHVALWRAQVHWLVRWDSSKINRFVHLVSRCPFVCELDNLRILNLLLLDLRVNCQLAEKFWILWNPIWQFKIRPILRGLLAYL